MEQHSPAVLPILAPPARNTALMCQAVPKASHTELMLLSLLGSCFWGAALPCN